MSAAFLEFAEVAEKIGATTKRLEKAALLGSYLLLLNDDDLIYAARYFAGYTFSLRDQRTTNVGTSALLNALVFISRHPPDLLKSKLVQLGDLGEVAAAVLPATEIQPTEIQPLLKLQDVAIALEQLAVTRGSKQKLEWIIKLLRQATPLEAKYLVKLLTGDLRIGLKESLVEDAIARLYVNKLSQIQWVNMLLGDIGETALLARHNQLNTAKMRLFHPIKFMLASPVDELKDVAQQMPPEFIVEDKYDGIRAQAHIAVTSDRSSGTHGVLTGQVRVALFSRTLDEITGSFPDLVEPLAALKQDDTKTDEASGLILDGEIVPIQGDRLLPFQDLQKRLGRKSFSEALLSEIPVAFIAYDLLYANGKLLIHKPLAVRQQMLESLHLNTPEVRQATSKVFQTAAALDDEFQAARDRGNEGLMIKNPASAYKPGRRGKDWLKLKRALATLDVVVTAVEVGTGRRHNVLSDYTFAVRASETDATLLNVGKAYSGLTDAEIAELSEWFRAHTVQEFAHGRVRLVEPAIVLEVAFDRVQPSSRPQERLRLTISAYFTVAPGQTAPRDRYSRNSSPFGCPPIGLRI